MLQVVSSPLRTCCNPKNELKTNLVYLHKLLRSPHMSTWTDTLKEFRRRRKEVADGDNDALEILLKSFLPRFSEIGEVLSQYLDLLSSNNGANQIEKDEKSVLINNTRSALRFGVSCLSMPTDETRSTAQDEVIRSGWHEVVIQIVCHSRGDSKCRLYAAQLLSNLVTMNSQTAQVIRAKMKLTPSNESISATILSEALSHRASATHKQQQEPILENEPNWVDAMLTASKTGNRNALAAVVAALHNCLLSQSTKSEQDGYAQHISSSSLLMSTILRHLVSVNAIVSNEKTRTTVGLDHPQNPADDTTEWIVIFLMQLCRRGCLPSMYQAVGKKPLENVFPEQTVLLHCLRCEVERQTSCRCAMLGAGDSAVVSHVFLARVVCSLLSTKESKTSNDVSREEALQKSAFLTILDVLAETLAEESADSESIRRELGKTELVPLLCQELGQLYDELTLRNSGRTSRDVLVKDDEQAKLTVVVRVIGNLVFECPLNQDLLRTARVECRLPGGTVAPERSGLHVLLSCTSYAHACFTLREWAVIAIRNVLHENIANQHVVAELEAQRAVQSAELRDMGIRVELDKGQVSVAPLREQYHGDDGHRSG